jgi:hypothetical protein
MLVHSDDRDETVLSLDQPSTLCASTGDTRITQVGHALDRKVSDLLCLIGIDATAAFVSRHP